MEKTTNTNKTMTKAQKIAEIMRIMMKLSGESPEAIKAMQEKCLQSDHSRKAEAEQSEKGGASA